MPLEGELAGQTWSEGGSILLPNWLSTPDRPRQKALPPTTAIGGKFELKYVEGNRNVERQFDASNDTHSESGN